MSKFFNFVFIYFSPTSNNQLRNNGNRHSLIITNTNLLIITYCFLLNRRRAHFPKLNGIEEVLKLEQKPCTNCGRYGDAPGVMMYDAVGNAFCSQNCAWMCVLTAESQVGCGGEEGQWGR